MSLKRFTLIFFILLLLGCGENFTPDAGSPRPSKSPVETVPPVFVIAIDKLNVRAAPNDTSSILSQLEKGKTIQPTGKLSEHSNVHIIRGVKRTEPWIEIYYENPSTAWVYGGGLQIRGGADSDLASRIRKQRLNAFLGKKYTEEILAYRQQYHEVDSANDFIDAFILGKNTRDSIVTILTDNIQIREHKQVPDLSWLEDAMPAYTMQLAAEGTTYYPFQDYEKMSQLAKTTIDSYDDEVLKWVNEYFDSEGQESFFPSYFLQTWDYGGQSLLGTGRHFALLKDFQALYDQNPIQTKKLFYLKDRLLNDILDTPGKMYNESSEEIVEELESLLNANFTILDEKEIQHLKERKEAFRNPAAHDLQLNLKLK